MNPIEKVNDFLTQAETFYLTTVDGDRPKCRPVAFHMLAGTGCISASAISKRFTGRCRKIRMWNSAQQ